MKKIILNTLLVCYNNCGITVYMCLDAPFKDELLYINYFVLDKKNKGFIWNSFITSTIDFYVIFSKVIIMSP